MVFISWQLGARHRAGYPGEGSQDKIHSKIYRRPSCYSTVDSIYAFYPVVVVLYFLLPKKLKNLWLLGASYYFYMGWNAKYIVLLLFTTIVTYTGSWILERYRKRWVLAPHGDGRAGDPLLFQICPLCLP